MISNVTLTAATPTALTDGQNDAPIQLQNTSPLPIEIWEGGTDDYASADKLTVAKGEVVCLPNLQYSGRSEDGGSVTLLKNLYFLDTGIPREPTGNIPVALQDQTMPMVVAPLHIDLNSGNLIASAVAVDDTQVTLTAGHGATPGDSLFIKEDGRCFSAGILTVVTNLLTLDTPFDYAFTPAASVCVCDVNLNVDGSSVIKTARVKPPAGTLWNITRLHVRMVDDTVMDAGTFAGIAALTRGVVLRVHNGIVKNVANVKTNGDLISVASYYSFDDKPPSGEYGFTSNHVFGGQEHVGVVIRLDGDEDELRVLIQDDLTGIGTLRITAIGHVVRD